MKRLVMVLVLGLLVGCAAKKATTETSPAYTLHSDSEPSQAELDRMEHNRQLNILIMTASQNGSSEQEIAYLYKKFERKPSEPAVATNEKADLERNREIAEDILSTTIDVLTFPSYP